VAVQCRPLAGEPEFGACPVRRRRSRRRPETIMTIEAENRVRALFEDHPPKATRDPLRVLVAALVGVEAALLLVAAGFLVFRATTSDQESPLELISLAAIALAVGAGLAWCARGVLAGLRWTRGPVLTWQLLQAAVGAPLCSMGSWRVGVPLLAVAVVAGVLIAGPRVVPWDSDRF
jgi:hypothetical protein